MPRLRWWIWLMAACAIAGGLGYLGGESPVAALALAGAALVGMAVAVRPDVATLIVAAVLYSNAAVIMVQFHGVPGFMALGVPLLLVAPLGYLLIVERQPVVVPPAMPLILVYFLIEVLGALFSISPDQAAADVLTFVVEGLGIFFLVTNVVRSVRLLEQVVWVLLLVGAALGGLSLFQQATGTYSNNYGGFAQMSQAVLSFGGSVVDPTLQPRLAGPIGEKNRYAQVLLMLVPLGIFWAVNARGKTARALAIVCTILISVGVALTFSRGAAVGFLFVLMTMVGMGYIKPSQVLLVVLAGVIVLVLVPSYAARVGSLMSVANFISGDPTAANPDGSILSRVTEGLAALMAAADHPVLGVGPGLFPIYYHQYAEIVGIRVLNADREAHDLYLGIMAENGIPGLLVFLGIIGVTMRDLRRARRRWLGRRPDLANIATAFLLAELTYLATGIFLHLSYARYYWLTLALAAAAAVILLGLPDEVGAADAQSPPERRRFRRWRRPPAVSGAAASA